MYVLIVPIILTASHNNKLTKHSLLIYKTWSSHLESSWNKYWYIWEVAGASVCIKLKQLVQKMARQENVRNSQGL